MRQKEYIIPLKAVAWSRTGANHTTRTFFDRQKKEKLCFGMYLASQHNDEPLFQVPSIDIIFYFKEPIKKKPENYPLHTRKPDGDNCQKFIYDVLKGIAYDDDCQIPMGSFQKRWGEEDIIKIIITELKGEK